MKFLLFFFLLSSLSAAVLPPGAEALRKPIEAAERRLQDASLELQAAKHDAVPLQNQVIQARPGAGSWWGSWLLKRRLGQLKISLDKVEAARAAQAAAREDLALLLTGAQEELLGAMEISLAVTPKASAVLLEKWKAWWQQREIWQQRLEALGAGDDETVETANGNAESKRIRTEARQAQLERENALVAALKKHRVLP